MLAMSKHHEHGVYGASTTAPELLTVNELRGVLKVSRGTVYKLVNRGELPAVRVGERLRFRPADVDRYLERGSP